MTIETASVQIAAAGAALALLSAHPDLPAPDVELREILAEADGVLGWGVRLSLHGRLDHFEQWRRALDIDPAAVTEHTANGAGLGWWRAVASFIGVPVSLTGFYDLPPDGE